VTVLSQHFYQTPVSLEIIQSYAVKYSIGLPPSRHRYRLRPTGITIAELCRADFKRRIAESRNAVYCDRCDRSVVCRLSVCHTHKAVERNEISFGRNTEGVETFNRNLFLLQTAVKMRL